MPPWDKIKLKAGIFGAEAWSEEMRQDIQDKLGIKAYDIYGLNIVLGIKRHHPASRRAGCGLDTHTVLERRCQQPVRISLPRR